MVGGNEAVLFVKGLLGVLIVMPDIAAPKNDEAGQQATDPKERALIAAAFGAPDHAHDQPAADQNPGGNVPERQLHGVHFTRRAEARQLAVTG